MKRAVLILVMIILSGCLYKPDPIANFTVDKGIVKDKEVRFINESAYAESYIWDFDDGSKSYDKNPVHVFDVTGRYFVTLTAIKGNKKDSKTVELIILTY